MHNSLSLEGTLAFTFLFGIFFCFFVIVNRPCLGRRSNPANSNGLWLNREVLHALFQSNWKTLFGINPPNTGHLQHKSTAERLPFCSPHSVSVNSPLVLRFSLHRYHPPPPPPQRCLAELRQLPYFHHACVVWPSVKSTVSSLEIRSGFFLLHLSFSPPKLCWARYSSLVFDVILHLPGGLAFNFHPRHLNHLKTQISFDFFQQSSFHISLFLFPLYFCHLKGWSLFCFSGLIFPRLNFVLSKSLSKPSPPVT